MNPGQEYATLKWPNKWRSQPKFRGIFLSRVVVDKYSCLTYVPARLQLAIKISAPKAVVYVQGELLHRRDVRPHDGRIIGFRANSVTCNDRSQCCQCIWTGGG